MHHEPPAHVAPAVASRTADSSTAAGSHAALRVGGTVGLGGGGLGGTVLGATDIWPGRSFGFGLEGMLGGGSDLKLPGPKGGGAMSAGRLRVSLRVLKGNNTELSGTFALGVASWGTDQHDRNCIDEPEDASSSEPTGSSLPECDSSSFERSATITRSGVDVSGAIELGARTRVRLLEVGAVVRFDFGGDVALVTVGPTVGVAF